MDFTGQPKRNGGCMPLARFGHSGSHTFWLARAIFRDARQAALIAAGKAIALYAVILSVLLSLHQWPTVQRSLGLLQALVHLMLLVLVGVNRAFRRQP